MIAINFMSAKDNDEERVMHSKSDNIEIIINDEPDEVKEKLFQSYFSRYQIGLETLMNGSVFIFDCVHLLYYKYYKIIFKRGRSYIDFLDWIKKQKRNNKPHQEKR